MLRRLFVGLVLGLLVGGAVGAVLVAGFGVHDFAGTGGAILAYFAAAVAGVLTGLVAGKPIWARGAKIEAGLKAIFGALLGAGTMFALRHWGASLVPPSIAAIPAIGANGATAIGDLPLSLPLLMAVLGILFELDNTNEDAKDGKGSPLAQGGSRFAVGAARAEPRAAKTDVKVSEAESDDDERGSRRAKH